jgi:hypothetical protein
MTPSGPQKSWNDGWNGSLWITRFSFQKSFRERKSGTINQKSGSSFNKIKPFQWNAFYIQINMGWGVFTPPPMIVPFHPLS